MAEPPLDRAGLPGSLPPEPGKQTPLLFPTCCCAVQIFALESAALPRAPQPRPVLAGRLLTPGTEDGSCSDAKSCSLMKGNHRPRAGLTLRGCSVGIWDLPWSGVGRCCRSPWSLWAPATGPSSSSPSLATSTAGKSPGEGGSGARREVSTLSRSTPGCREHGRGNAGCSGPSGVHARLKPPQNPRTCPGDTPAEGRALGRAGKLLEGLRGKSQPFLYYFSTSPLLLEMHFWLAGSWSGVCGGSWARLGDFRAGIWGRGPCGGSVSGSAVAFLALPALPSPGLRAARSWTSPRRLGHWPLFRRIKLALLLSLSLFQQFLPPLSLGSGETFLPGGCQEK